MQPKGLRDKLLGLVGIFLAGFVLFLSSTQTGRAAGTVTDCSTPGPGAGTLQAALEDGGNVQFACSGTLNFTTPFTITTNTTIDASGQNVVLDGGGITRLLVVEPGVTLRVNNLSFANGKDGNKGAAILNRRGNLEIFNSKFLNNEAPGGTLGDDFADYYEPFQVVISNTEFTANKSNFTAAVRFTASTSDLKIYNSTFRGNIGTNSDGGAVYMDAGKLTVESSTFENNTARNGGAIAVYGRRATITDSIFRNNQASNGGAIYIQYTDFTLNRSQLYNNIGLWGGAIYNVIPLAALPFTTRIQNSVIATNTAQFGGGMVNRFLGDPRNPAGVVTSTVTGTTFYNNTGTSEGGALYNFVSSSVAPGTRLNFSLSNSTVSGNRASTGGGLYNAGASSTLINNTFVANSADTSGGSLANIQSASNAAGGVTLTNMLLATGNCAGSMNDGGNNLQTPGTGCNLPEDAVQIMPLGNYGGSTPVHLVMGANVDAGNNAVCSAPSVNGVDQRGVARPEGNSCDIGAVEISPYMVFRASDSGNVTNAGSLSYAIEQAAKTSQAVTITFATPYVDITKPLPLISNTNGARVTIAGGCNNGAPGVMLRASAQNLNGLVVQSNVTLVGLHLGGFTGWVLSLNGNNNELLCSYIGNVTGDAALANQKGVLVAGSANRIGRTDAPQQTNFIGGNTEIGVLVSGGANNTMAYTRLGYTVNGNTPAPNGGGSLRVDRGAQIKLLTGIGIKG
jgi:predicted outer membrane repeat protein